MMITGINRENASIVFTMNGRTGHLVLNRPPANPMTPEFFSDLNSAVNEMRRMKDLGAIVISGCGRHFSSGAELGELMALSERMRDDGEAEEPEAKVSFFEQNRRSFLFFEEAQVPVISAIRGVCIGSAFELALFTHFRFCGEDSVFGLPETNFNLIPGVGGIGRMESLCGTAKTIELVMKGSTFDAAEALDCHLVDRILPKRQIVEYALNFADLIPEGYKKEKRPLYLQRIPVA